MIADAGGKRTNNSFVDRFDFDKSLLQMLFITHRNLFSIVHHQSIFHVENINYFLHINYGHNREVKKYLRLSVLTKWMR